jgi:MFS transporter, DHA1 family, multidrug resistance protein
LIPGWLRERAFGLIVSEWGLCVVGHLAAVSILSLYLLTSLRLTPGLAAGLLLFATLSFRVGRFLLAPVLDRLPPRPALMLCLALGIAGYMLLSLLPYSSATFAAAVLLAGAGFGGNTLRVYALASGQETGRLYRYSALNVATNVAAAIGPLFGTWLFLHLGPRSPFALATAAFLAAAALVLLIPGESLEQPARSEGWWSALRACLASPGLRQSMLVRTLLFVMTSQLYAVFPLAATRMLDAAGLLGIYFTVNALLVSVGQIPVTRLAMALSASPRALIAAGFASYSLGFALLWLWPNRVVAFGMVAACSLAETLIPPPTDSLVGSALPDSLRVAGFTLNMLAAAAGEAVGVFTGVWAAGRLSQGGKLSLWYGVLALISFGAVVLTTLLVRRPASAAVVID